MEFPGIGGNYCQNINVTHNLLPNPTPVYVIGLTSDIFAIFGSIFIIVTYFLFKDLKTRARQFLLLIAVSDLLNAVSYSVAHSYSLSNWNYTICYSNKTQAEIWTCVFQASANNFFTLCSFSFTILLALHILLLFHQRNVFKGNRNFYISVFAGICIPFLVTTFAFWAGWFGPGPSVTAGWCFIRDFKEIPEDDNRYMIYEFLTGKVWDLITVISISFFYVLILIRYFRSRRLSHRNFWKSVGDLDIKLFCIPIVFILIRMWGEFHLFLSFIYWYKKHGDTFFLYPQAFFEPAQGWANALIYIIFTKRVRKRLNKSFYRKPRSYQTINEIASD